jgi:hypothetical protein
VPAAPYPPTNSAEEPSFREGVAFPSKTADGKYNLGIVSEVAFGIAGALVICLIVPGAPHGEWVAPKILALGVVGGYGGRAIIDTCLADKVRQLRTEVFSRIDKDEAQLQEQREIDARALLLVSQHLEREPGSPVNEAEMREAILRASPAIAVQIFEAARRARRRDRSNRDLIPLPYRRESEIGPAFHPQKTGSP